MIRALLGEMSLLKENAREGGSEGGVNPHTLTDDAHSSEGEIGREEGDEQGTVRVRGSLAYVPQTAWVPNEAFR